MVLEAAGNGSLIVQYGDWHDQGFMEYFKNMTLKSNTYTWFRSFGAKRLIQVQI